MLSFLQSDSFPENIFFLLAYFNEDCIKPFYYSKIGAKILKIAQDTLCDQNIAATMNQSLKKMIKDVTLFSDSIYCTIPNPTSTETDAQVYVLSLRAIKHNDTFIIFSDGLVTQNKYSQMIGKIPKIIFEQLIISNPNHILFGFELDLSLDLILTCYGPAIPFLLDYPLPAVHAEKIRLDSLLTPSNYCIIKSHVLQCLNNEGNHSFVYYQESATKKKYYNIRIISDLQHGKKSIYGTAIDITDFINAKQNVCPLHQNILKLFDQFDEAACTVFAKKNSSSAIESQTKKFSELLKLNPEFPFHLLTPRMRDHLLLNNTPLNLKKKLKTINNTERDYDITITPFFQEDQGSLLIVTALLSTPPLPFKLRAASILTPREQQVIKFVLNGEKNIVIACHLNITEGTVKKIISNAYKKLNVTSRTELIKQYFVLM